MKHLCFNINRQNSIQGAERNRKSGKEGLGLSENTIRKLSALLWYKENGSNVSNDCDVKAEESKSSNDNQQKDPMNDGDNKSPDNNNDPKISAVGLKDNYTETNEKNEKDKMKSINNDKPQHKETEVHVQILHHGKL